MRPANEIGAELDKNLGEVERITGIQIDDLLREEIGAGQWLAAGEAPAKRPSANQPVSATVGVNKIASPASNSSITRM